jgi:pilus assembly protein CpaB
MEGNLMNKQTIIPLVIGLAIGLVALKIGYDYVSKLKSQAGNNMGPVQKVVLARNTLYMGSKISEKDVTLVSMPTRFIPEGAIRDIKEVVGQTTKITTLAKMPILLNTLGQGEGLEGIIPIGYRAIAVKVDEFSSVGGLLKPGCKVDVLGTFKFKKPSGCTETISKLILENVEVRAVGQTFRREETDTLSAKAKPSQSVSLLVRDDQAEVLQLAASTGAIRLALRSVTDDKPSNSKGVTMAQMLFQEGGMKLSSGSFGTALASLGAKKSSTLKSPNDPYMVEVITGTKLEQIYFASSTSDKRVEPAPAPAPSDTKKTDLDSDNLVISSGE